MNHPLPGMVWIQLPRGEDRESHLGGYFWKRFGEKVCRSHAGLHRAERMLDRLATLAHGMWVRIKALLHSFAGLRRCERRSGDPWRRSSHSPGCAFFAYSDNYLIDVKFGVIVDVEASRAMCEPWRDPLRGRIHCETHGRLLSFLFAVAPNRTMNL